MRIRLPPRPLADINGEIVLFAKEHPGVNRRALRSAGFVCFGRDLPLCELLPHLDTCNFCKIRYTDVAQQTVFYKPGPLPPA